MKHEAVKVYAVDVDTFSKLIEGEISLHAVVYSERRGKLKLRPTGRVYSTPDFGGFTFIECMETN